MSKSQAKITPVRVWWELAQVDLQVWLVGGGSVALVDTAAPGTDLVAALGATGLGLNDVELVLNTHAHHDHVAHNAVLKSSGAQICIHQDEKVFVEDPVRCFESLWAPLAGGLHGGDGAGDYMANWPPAAYAGMVGPGVPVDRTVTDGDLIVIGDSLELQVFHLPGHTPGSVGYYWEETETMIAGDAVGGLGLPDGSLPLILDLPSYRRSVERLLDLPITRLYTTHPYRGRNLVPAWTREGADVTTFLEESRNMAVWLAERTSTQPTPSESKTLIQIADEVLATAPPAMGLKPVGQQALGEVSMHTIFHALRSRG